MYKFKPEKIKEWRKKRGILTEERRVDYTQEGLEKAAGLSAGHLGKIERGERLPSADILSKIANALGIHPGNFWEKIE